MNNGLQADIVIVGAGSAGAVLAARLTEDAARTVILIEAGPDYPDDLPPDLRLGNVEETLSPASQHLWRFVGRGTELVPQMFVPRGMVVGGTSAINGQVFLRGVPEDYDAWAEGGNPGWTFADVLPYFKLAESDHDFAGDFHGVSGPTPVSRGSRDDWLPVHEAFHAACVESGFPATGDHNHPDATGVGPIPTNNVGGLRMSTAVCYLPAARRRPNLVIRARTRARRIVFEGQRAVGVEVDGPPGAETLHACEVILAAGTIGSPHLLLVSGVGPAEQLRRFPIQVVAESRGVGENLWDHPLVYLDWRGLPGPPLSRNIPLARVCLRTTAPASRDRNDFKVSVMDLPGPSLNGPADSLVRMAAGLQAVAGRGRLWIESAEVAVHPRLDYAFLEHTEDRRRMREMIRLCVELGVHRCFGKVTGERLTLKDTDPQDDCALDTWLTRNVTTSHHIGGTCRMGPADDRLAVVDHTGHVHGVEGLRVVDASIMPAPVRANTNASTIMLAERIAATMVADKSGRAVTGGQARLDGLRSLGDAAPADSGGH